MNRGKSEYHASWTLVRVDDRNGSDADVANKGAIDKRTYDNVQVFNRDSQ